MAETVPLARNYKKGDRVELQDLDTQAWTGITHLVLESNQSSWTRVTTACGILRFVSYARPKRKRANCIECLAMEG